MGGIVPTPNNGRPFSTTEDIKKGRDARLAMVAAIKKGIAGAINVAGILTCPQAEIAAENGLNDPGDEPLGEFCKIMDYQAQELKRNGKGTQVYTKDNDQGSKPGEVMTPAKGDGKVNLKGI